MLKINKQKEASNIQSIQMDLNNIMEILFSNEECDKPILKQLIKGEISGYIHLKTLLHMINMRGMKTHFQHPLGTIF